MITIIGFIDIRGYFENAILINQKYYVQIAGGGNPMVSILKAVMTPFMYLFNGVNIPEMAVVKVMIVAIIGMTISLIYRKKYSQVGWIWVILTLANLRNFELAKTYYDGFHLIVWIGLVLAIPYLLAKKWWWGMIPLFALVMINKSAFMYKSNYGDEFEIYYSRIYNMSEAIRTTKNDQDRLLSMPDVVLGYWQAGVKPAGRFIFFYKWMTGVSELKSEQMKNFDSKPEYLIIGNKEGLAIETYLKSYKNFGYRGSGGSEFYVRDDLFKSFPKEKVERLKYYGLEAI